MKKGTLPMAYWHHLPGVCNHLASYVGGECHRPDEGVWTPLYPASVDAPRLTAERDAARAEADFYRGNCVDHLRLDAAEREATRLREALTTDGAWLARLARGSSWPGEMAHRVEAAADRIIALNTPPTDQGEGA